MLVSPDIHQSDTRTTRSPIALNLKNKTQNVYARDVTNAEISSNYRTYTLYISSIASRNYNAKKLKKTQTT